MKQKLNEWTDRSFKDLPKRWSKSTKDTKDGLTEFERKGGKDNQTLKNTKKISKFKF